MGEHNVFFVGLSFAFLGLYFLFYSIRAIRDIEASKAWPSVKGQVLESEVIRYDATSSRRDVYLQYIYEVDGKQFKGNTPVLYTVIHQNDAERLVRQFPKGMATDVYYKPDQPTISVLLPGEKSPDGKKYSGAYISLLVFLVGAVLCFAKYNAFITAYGG